MDVLMLSTAIAALAAAMLAVSCVALLCIIMRRRDEEASVAVEKAESVRVSSPSVRSVRSEGSEDGSFTLPLPPGFGTSTARLF
jgi:hypothetical protein